MQKCFDYQKGKKKYVSLKTNRKKIYFKNILNAVVSGENHNVINTLSNTPVQFPIIISIILSKHFVAFACLSMDLALSHS